MSISSDKLGSCYPCQLRCPHTQHKTWYVHTELKRCLNVQRSRSRRIIPCRLKILNRFFIFQVLHFPVPQIPVHIGPPFSRFGIFHPLLYGPSFQCCIFSAPIKLWHQEDESKVYSVLPLITQGFVSATDAALQTY